MYSKTDNMICFGLLALLIFAPLAYGANHIWSYTLIELAGCGLLFVWMIRQAFFDAESECGNHLQTGIIRTPLNYVLLAFMGIALIQLLPLPVSFIRLLSPNTFKAYSKALDHLNGFRSISLYSHATTVELMKFLAYAAIFLVTLHWADRRWKIHWIIIAIVGVGFFQAIYGILQYLSGHQHIWGYKKIWYTDCVTGTYINRNHFAGYLEIAISLAFGLLIYLTHKGEAGNHKKQINRIRDIFIRFDQSDPYRSKKFLLIFIIVVMAAALILSGSRGGILSLTIAFILMNTLLITKRKVFRCAMITLFISWLVLFLGLYMGMGPTLRRFAFLEKEALTRLKLSRASFELVSEFPVLGTGLGTFEHVFRKVKSSELNRIVNHAHNDWLELVVEMGGIGFLLIMMASIWWLFHFIRVWWKRRSSFSLGISLGGMGAFLSLSLHSLTDFNMHIPANALTFAVVLAITLLALHLRINQENSCHELDLPRYHGHFDNRNLKDTRRHEGCDRDGSVKGFMREIMTRTFIYLVLLVMFILVPFRIIKPYLAERHIQTVPNSVSAQLQEGIEKDQDILIKKAIKAIQRDERNAEYFYRLAMTLKACHEKGDYAAIGQNRALISQIFHISPSYTDVQACNEMIEEAFRKAIDLNPVNPFYHYSLGAYYMKKVDSFRKSKDDQWRSFLARADLEFERSLYFFPNSPKLLFNIGNYWFWKSTLLGDPLSKKDAIKQASHYYLKLISLDPSYEKDISRIVESL